MLLQEFLRGLALKGRYQLGSKRERLKYGSIPCSEPPINIVSSLKVQFSILAHVHGMCIKQRIQTMKLTLF